MSPLPLAWLKFRRCADLSGFLPRNASAELTGAVHTLAPYSLNFLGYLEPVVTVENKMRVLHIVGTV
jgi:hypothetical protein